MKPDQSAEVLKCRLGAGFARLPFYELLEAALDFYADQRAEGLAASAQSDMLLFQYGCYDWKQGAGEWFEFDLTRQFMAAEEIDDDAISQLRLTVYFAPDDPLRALGRHNEWCGAREKLVAFRQAVFTSEAFAFVAARPRARVEIEWGKV